jgi:protein tyrosine/serine phosphatase
MLHRLKFSVVAMALALLFGAGCFLYIEKQGNFHVITSGEAYRSAILDRGKLDYYIKKYNIKSIVNLLGKKPKEAWYKEEIEFCADQNVKHYDVNLPVSHEPTEEDVRKLVEIFKNAPRPVLIHCKAGADRSGLAAAMWKVIVDKEPKSEAAKQLSIWYGHIPIGKTIAMDRFFEKWNPVID